MTITVGSFTKIDSHDDLARCYRCLWQNLARSKNQVDCRIYCRTRAQLEKHIAGVFSLSVCILCSFLVKKPNSMIIDHLGADSMLGKHVSFNLPGLFWHT